MASNGTELSRALSVTVSAVVIATMAAAAVVVMFQGNRPIVVALTGGILLLVFLMLSGNPRLFCLWGLVLSAPLELGKKFMSIPHMGGAGAYSIEVVDIFILLMLFFILRDFFWGYRRRLRLSWVAFFWGGMIALGILTMVTGPFRHVAGHEVLRMAKCLLLFLILINELVRTRQFMHVFGALTVGIGIQAIVGLTQYLLASDLGLQVLGEATKESVELTAEATYRSRAEGYYRIGALLGHSNLLAGYIALLVPICIAVLLAPVRQVYKLGAGLVAAGAAVVLVLTLSRTGWVDFGVAFTALVLLSFLHPRMRRRMLIARLGMVALLGILVIGFSGPIAKRLTESDPGALNFRYEFMGVAWKMVKERPALGFGLNSFVFQMGPYTRYGTPSKLTERFGDNWPVVHNIYLLTWAEQGTVGFVLFLGLLAYLLWIGMRNARDFGNEVLYAINIGCIAGILAISVDGLTSFFIRNAGPARMFWIVAALIVAISYWQKENRHPVQRASGKALPATGALQRGAAL